MILLQNGQTRQTHSFDGRIMVGGLGLGEGKEGRRRTLPIGLFYLGDNFKTALRKLRGNFETILGQPWDIFETTLRQLGTSMRQFWDNFEVAWTLSKLFWAYETFADVPESLVWWRANLQSGYRVLKKVILFLSISMAYNVISCQKVAENTQILKNAKFAM